MGFVLQIGYETHQKTIPNFLVSILREHGIESTLTHENGQIVCTMREDHPRLQEALNSMGQILPPSVFMRGSSHRFAEENPTELPEFFDTPPLGLGVCPQCQKEMFDPSSRRYYYPFTSCSHCGGQYALFEAYPYRRENTALHSLEPCSECRDELSSNPFRSGYPQIGCHQCAVPIRLQEGEKISYGADPVANRSFFAKAAAAIGKGERVRIKTTLGHRLFFRPDRFLPSSVLMMLNPSRIMSRLALIDEEFQAMMSIERPILHVSVSDEGLRSQVGESVEAQYCDDGFALLLGRELTLLGMDCVAFTECDETETAEIVIDFDLPIRSQSPMRLFLNKETRFIARGERGVFPAYLPVAADVASFAHGLAAIRLEKGMVVDQVERFSGTRTSKVNALRDEELLFTHSNLQRMDQDIASCMAVLSENGLRGSTAVCAYFDETITFLLAKKGQVTRVIPSEPFVREGLIGKIERLREGSDRLVHNIRQKEMQLYEMLERIERSDAGLLEAAAMIIGLEHPSADALIRESLRFSGKGGLQIDTKLKDNRFDNVAFLASIISYKMAKVPASLLCYSVFESLGDYFSDILTELKNRSKAQEIVLSGSGFANQRLYSREMRNLKNTPPVLARSFPIGRENGVVGGIYL